MSHRCVLGLLLVACNPVAGATTSTGSSSSGAAGSTSETPTTSPDAASTSSSSTSTSTTGASPTSGQGTAATSSGGTSSGGDTSSGADPSSTGAAALTLRISPASATVTVASGWSHPQRFVAELVDADMNATPVAAEWALGDPALGWITAHGGSFEADNTAAGVAQISATHLGLAAVAELKVEQLGDHPGCPPLPPLTDGAPSPGAYVKVVAPEYAGKGVYHGLYLPPDWQPGRRWPVIVESPCNKYQGFLGKVDDTRLGYHLAGCRSFIVVVFPYIQADANLDSGWGDVPAAVAYWDLNLRRTLAEYGGDPGSVIGAGFSRGAISTSYVGLNSELIADHWLGFFMHSHADVITNLTPDQGAGSAVRMGRVDGRAALLSWGAAGDGGMANSQKGVALLTANGDPVTTLAVPGVGHTDAWMIDDPVARASAQDWLFATVAARPGTHTIRGRVTDPNGDGVADATIAVGEFHVARSDSAGYYALRGLLPGAKLVACSHAQLECAAQAVVLADVDLALDFAAS